MTRPPSIKKPQINYKKGFFRIWLVLSAIFYAFLITTEGSSTLADLRFLKSHKETITDILGSPEAARMKMTRANSTESYDLSDEQNLRVFYAFVEGRMTSEDAAAYVEDTRGGKIDGPTQSLISDIRRANRAENALRNFSLLAIGPIFILLLGVSIAWCIRGFQIKKG